MFMLLEQTCSHGRLFGEITTFMYDGLIQGVDWNNKPNSKTFLKNEKIKINK